MDEYAIRRVKEAAEIYDVVSDFVELRKTGARWTGICPFHDDRHDGNFIVYPAKNVYKCFACEAKGGPIEFVMKAGGLSFADAVRWIGKKYGIDVDGKTSTFAPPPPRKAPKALPMLVIPWNMVTARERLEGDVLVDWLRRQNWDACQRERLEEVLKVYHVGHSKQGMTIWWQIDNLRRVRTGKMMRYGKDGHRDKVSQYNFDFIHAALMRSDKFPEFDRDKVEMVQTLFGMHLLDEYRDGTVNQDVCIAESEKTAVIMAIAYGNNARQVWMACGGLENLTREKLMPIIEQGRRIVLYPDRDGIEKWKAKAEQLGYDKVTVDVRPVTEWWRPEDGEKADIADVVLRMINEKKIYKTVGEVVKDIPSLKALKNLDLDII